MTRMTLQIPEDCTVTVIQVSKKEVLIIYEPNSIDNSKKEPQKEVDFPPIK